MHTYTHRHTHRHTHAHTHKPTCTHAHMQRTRTHAQAHAQAHSCTYMYFTQPHPSCILVFLLQLTHAVKLLTSIYSACARVFDGSADNFDVLVHSTSPDQTGRPACSLRMLNFLLLLIMQQKNKNKKKQTNKNTNTKQTKTKKISN